MKRLFSLALAALALTACAAPRTGATAETAQTDTPEAAQTDAAEPSAGADGPAFTVGTLFHLPDTGTYWGYNAGDAYYEIADITSDMPGALVLKTDYATLTQAPVCHLPGCPHNSEDCVAYLADSNRTLVFVLDGQVYLYHASYDREFLEQQSNDEEFEAWLQGQVLTPTQEAAQRAARSLDLQPSFIDVISADGLTRERLLTLPDTLDWNTIFRYCDGRALYGWRYAYGSYGPAVGIRLDLHTGQIDEFKLLKDESMVGVYGNRIVTRHIVSDEPLNNDYDDAHYAAFQNANVEFDLLDPATGERRKVCALPTSYYDNGSILGLYHDRLYFESTGYRNGRVDAFQVEYYDLNTRQTQVLRSDLYFGLGWFPEYPFSFMPPDAEGERDYLWMESIVSASYITHTDYMLDLHSGEMYQITQGAYNTANPASVMAQTNDGRWLIGYERISGNRCLYGLIDPQAFLQGSTNYDFVQSYP